MFHVRLGGPKRAALPNLAGALEFGAQPTEGAIEDPVMKRPRHD